MVSLVPLDAMDLFTAQKERTCGNELGVHSCSSRFACRALEQEHFRLENLQVLLLPAI